jgi:hypothetical protein
MSFLDPTKKCLSCNYEVYVVTSQEKKKRVVGDLSNKGKCSLNVYQGVSSLLSLEGWLQGSSILYSLVSEFP